MTGHGFIYGLKKRGGGGIRGKKKRENRKEKKTRQQNSMAPFLDAKKLKKSIRASQKRMTAAADTASILLFFVYFTL